jgi:uncharacterized protein (TIGR03437 family)
MRTHSILLLTTVLSCSAWGQTYTISTIAGGALPVNVSGTSASLGYGVPRYIAADHAGNVFFVDQNTVLRLDATTGVLTLVAGNGTMGFSGDNGPATSAQLNNPGGVAVDSAGNLYIADSGNARIRKVSGGVITTVAGGGSSGFFDTGPATSAQLWAPGGIALDSNGNLYFADTALYGLVRKVSGGVITTVAGGGSSGLGDNGPATSAQLYIPWGVAVDSAGNLYIADTYNNRIRKVSNGVITTVAGNGTQGSSGDNGPATSAQLSGAMGIAVDSAGNVYVADSGNIRKVSNGVIATVAGNGTQGFSGDNGPATSAQLYIPWGVAVDSAGNLYIADTYNNRIRKVTNGVITTVAGNAACCFSGDNGPATSAQLYGSHGVAAGPDGSVYIADSSNNRIRKVSNSVITTVAGTGTAGFSGDNGPAISAQLTDPEGVAVDSAGNLYIADTGYSRVRKVTNGVITTVAGGGATLGDNGPATSAQLYSPKGVAVDSAGNLYIADTYNQRVRKVSNGVITTVAGTGTHSPSSGDNNPATSASLFSPTGVAVDSAGNVYVADRDNNRIRVLTPAAVTVRTPTIISMVNSASYNSGPISPGEVVTIFGMGIGPAAPAYGTTDSSTGKLTTMIGGVQVLFNGTAAPMIYASSTQVSAVVPYEMAFVANVSVWIDYLGQNSNADQVTSAATALGLFAQNSSGSGPGAILNQDNSLNGPGHPAAKGSIVQVFLTGEGLTNPPSVTGAITVANLPPPQVTPQPVQLIQVWIDGQPVNYTYAGEAPGMVAGVMQLNVQIPADAPSGGLSILVSVGGNMSQNGITVTVQ